MLESVLDQVNSALGYHQGGEEIQWWQMVLRTVVTFAITLLYARLGSKRFFSQNTAFDLIVGIMLGTTMATAIKGDIGLGAVMIAGLTLVLLHRLMAALTLKLSWLGPLLKGTDTQLIEDGQVNQRALRESNLSEGDLQQALRINGLEPDPSRIKTAYLERNGSITAVPMKTEPKILKVEVRGGVQTVRIRLE